MYLLPPATKLGQVIFTVRNEVAKVMFLQACVCSHEGGCLPQCMLGYHPPEADSPPGADPPREMATAVDGTHATGMHSCFTGIYDSVHRGGACMVARGVWL